MERGGWPGRTKETAGRIAARAGGQGKKGCRPEMCPLLSWLALLTPPSCSEIRHHLLGMEPPSSWFLPLPILGNLWQLSFQLHPGNAAPGRESGLSWRPSGGVEAQGPSPQPRDTKSKKPGSDTHQRRILLLPFARVTTLEPSFPHLPSAGLLEDCKH